MGKLLSALVIILSSSYLYALDPAISQCLGTLDVTKVRLICETSDVQFVLEHGASINISFIGDPRVLSTPVKIARLVPAGISPSGFTDEGVKFVGMTSLYIASFNLPCGQTEYAYVGLSKNTKALPNETVARCRM